MSKYRTNRGLEAYIKSNPGVVGGSSILETTKSYLLDGVDEHLNTIGTPDYRFIQNTGIFGFSIWQKTSDFTDGNLQCYMGNNSGSGSQAGVFIGVVGGVIRATVTTPTIMNSLSAAGAIADNDWHNVIVTGDGTNIFMWIDNVKQMGSGVFVNFHVGASGNAMGIGRINVVNTFNFEGNLTHKSIWDKFLSDADATEIYNLGKPDNLLNHTSSANLISWWQMQTFPEVIDEKGGNTATQVNMTAANLVTDAP